jgi:hypothetical protein
MSTGEGMQQGVSLDQLSIAVYSVDGACCVMHCMWQHWQAWSTCVLVRRCDELLLNNRVCPANGCDNKVMHVV